MNSVHEQCPISDSETVLSPKTRSKLSQVHRAPNLAQPAHTGAPRWACAALSWPLWPAVSWAQWSCRRRPSAMLQALCRVVAWLWPSLISSPLLVTIQFMYCDTNAQQPGSPCHDTINCIVTFTPCLSSLLLCHNTIGVLRHKFFFSSPA